MSECVCVFAGALTLKPTRPIGSCEIARTDTQTERQSEMMKVKKGKEHACESKGMMKIVSDIFYFSQLCYHLTHILSSKIGRKPPQKAVANKPQTPQTILMKRPNFAS